MNDDRPILGIALMLGFCCVAPMGDAVAKLLGNMPLVQVLFARFAAQALVLFPFISLIGRSYHIPRSAYKMVVIRTCLHMAGIATMFTALRYLPLADAIAIAFVCPFFLLLLGWLFMNEQVGLHRLLACVVGFIGTLLVIQPSFAAVGWNALWPLATAVIFALFIISTRSIAKSTDPLALQAISGLIASALMLPVLAVGSGSDIAVLQMVLPSDTEWMLLLAVGLLGTFAHLLMTWSLRYAPSATLAPMQYLEIPMATLIGWIVFTEFPNPLAGLGIAITMSAGLYAIWREQRATLPPRDIQPSSDV